MKKDEYLERLRSNTEKGLDIMSRKCSDYAGDENVFANFEAGEQFGMDAEEGLRYRMLDKVSRFFNLTREGANVKVADESVRDTALDLINYLNIWLVYTEHKKDSQSDIHRYRVC